MGDNSDDRNSIAIIGMSCRLPEANSPEEFWEVLRQGKDATSDVPKDRHCYDNLVKHLKRGGFLKCPVDEMDANFFNIPAKEAHLVDPQQRLLLEVAWEALEKAKINPLTLKGTKTGVFIGVWSNDYVQVLQNSIEPETCEFHLAYLGNALGATAARISYFLGLHGPHGAVDAGCASSMYSLHQACQSLRSKETNLAICGGTNLILYPVIGKLGSMVFSPDGRCKTFDAKVDGYGRAEGSGILILKRLSDATRDGDKILSIIRGVSVNSDAASSTFGNPCKFAQTKVIRNALADAKIPANKVTYIEAHGTGTEVGDLVEIASLVSGYYHRDRKQPLVIGSVKTNMGHAEAAAGIAGLIKLILSLQNKMIPPHINLKNLSPHLNFASIPGRIPSTCENWERVGNAPLMAGISSFALGGQNSHIILEEGPVQTVDTTKMLQNDEMTERPLHILALSAKCDKGLEAVREQYLSFLENNLETPIQDIAYSVNTTKAALPTRVAIFGKDHKEIMQNLKEKKLKPSTSGKSSGTPPPRKIAFIFNDECKGGNLKIPELLYNSNLAFKTVIDRCNKVSLDMNKGSLLTFNDKVTEKKINLPLLFSLQFALLKMWESIGITPNCVLGYGVGEFAAAAAAGVMSIEEAMKLVIEINDLLEEVPLVDSVSVLLKSDAPAAVTLMEKFPTVEIIGHTSRNEFLVSGLPEDLKEFGQTAMASGIQVIRSSQSSQPALYTKACKAVVENRIEDIVSSIAFSMGNCRYVSGTTGKILGDSHFLYDEEYWGTILTESVKFDQGVQTLAEQGCNVFIEIGPYPVLLSLAMNILPQSDISTCMWISSLRRDENSWKSWMNSLSNIFVSGLDLNWAGLDAGFPRKLVDLPTYPFQRQKFWPSTN